MTDGAHSVRDEAGYVPGDEGRTPWAVPDTVPDGFPTHQVRTHTLPDGREVMFRPILPEDGPRLVHVAHHPRWADERRNVLTGRTEVLDDADIAAMATVDYRDSFGLVGFACDGQFVALGRYFDVLRDPGRPVTALAAIATAWNYRDAGLGTYVMHALAARAMECGIDAFTSWIRTETVACRRLFEHTGGHRIAMFGGEGALYYGNIDRIPPPERSQTSGEDA